MNIESKIEFHVWALIRERLRDSLDNSVDCVAGYYVHRNVIDEVVKPMLRASVRTAINEYEY
jgi:hypothetical protein